MKYKKLIFIFGCLFLIFYFLFLTCTYALNLEKEIKAIEVVGLTRMGQEEFIDLSGFSEGDVIDREVLRTGIKRTFKKGFFLDIMAVTEPYDTGFTLKYIVKEIPVIKDIRISGNKKLSKRKIKNSFMYKKGDDFREEYLDKARADLLRFYYRRGFPDARVTIDIQQGKAQGELGIHIQIDEGQPLIIKNIQLKSELKNLIKIREGNIFDRGRVERDIKRLRNYFKKEQYIKPVIGPYEYKNGNLLIPVISGSRLEVEFKGNKVFSSKKLLKKVSFLEDEEVTPELLKETVRRIKKLYRNKGYDYTQVTGGIERERNLIRVVFFIFEGKKVILRKIKFEGAGIPSETIKAIISLREDKPFDRDLLSESRESITAFYNALGYLYAEVAEIREEFTGDQSNLNLTFVIRQGTQIKIQEIIVTGNEGFSTHEIKQELQLKIGAPYNAIDIGDARYSILSFYNRSGYINTEVEIENTIDTDTASVTFKITEHEATVFGKIIIRGNEKTKVKIVRREFVIKEGDPYNYDAIFKTRLHLSRLGLFTDISIEPLEISDFRKPDGKEEIRHTQDILIDLTEGKPGALEIGLGYGDYESLRGFFDITYRNIGGYNRLIGLRTELSSIKERFILNFREPWLFNKPLLPLNVYLTKEDIRSINLDTKEIIYKVDRLSFLAGVEKEFTERLKGSLNYEYSLIETSDVKPGVILTKEDTGTLGISSISTSLFYDTRNNPFDPVSGSLNGIILKFASGALFSETEFIKTIFQSSWYFQLKKGLILAFSLKGGIALGIKETDELPLVERFFLGGRTTVRGYEHDTLGPKGSDGNPTGGNVFALTNTELRISLGKGFGLVIFLDGGDVWNKINEIDSGLRYTAGSGLRYKTPVGPIRIDYGFKLNREGEESKSEVHFSLGHAF